MKKLLTSSCLPLLVLTLQFFTSQSRAQSITMGTLGTSSYCSGDTISVSFDVSGLFDHNNAFTLQLSDELGGFESGFTNLASIKDTLPGTFSFTTVLPAVEGANFRMRVLAAKPYLFSNDNGSDFSIGKRPEKLTRWMLDHGQQGRPAILYVQELRKDPLVSTHVDYGEDAFPSEADFGGNELIRMPVTYSTGGDKVITVTQTSLPSNCATTSTFHVNVYSCADPSIPSTAQVIYTDTALVAMNSNLWVNPGVTLSIIGSGDTVFAEPGSTINMNAGKALVYLKAGASATPCYFGEGIIVKSDSARVFGQQLDSNNLYICPLLQFNYTDAPPNKVMEPLAVLRSRTNTFDISIQPNPTTGSVSVHGLPLNMTSIALENILGAKVIELSPSGRQDATLDLSSIPAGVYYLRVASSAGVMTKKIVRE